MRRPPDFFDAPQDLHPERLFVLDRIGPTKGRLIIDVGCGAHKTIPEAIGLDVRPVADKVASMEALPFRDQSVDLLISRHSLEHALDTVVVLGEWRRILKPKGRVIIVLPDHEFVPTMDPFYSGGEHLHAFTRQSFANLIEALDVFRVEEMVTVVEEWSFGSVLKVI